MNLCQRKRQKRTETVSLEPVEEDLFLRLRKQKAPFKKKSLRHKSLKKELDVLQKKMAQNVQDLQEERNEAEKNESF